MNNNNESPTPSKGVKSLEEIKDEVAKKHGFKSCNDLEKSWGNVPERICDEAAELYASQFKINIVPASVCAKCGGEGSYQVGYSVTSRAVCECQSINAVNATQFIDQSPPLIKEGVEGKPDSMEHDCEFFLVTDVAVYACECDPHWIQIAYHGNYTNYVPEETYLKLQEQTAKLQEEMQGLIEIHHLQDKDLEERFKVLEEENKKLREALEYVLQLI